MHRGTRIAWWPFLGALAAGAALVVAGCGSSGSASGSSSSSGSGSGSTSGSAVTSLLRAADVSGSSQGFKLAMSLNESLGSEGTISATGTGAFDVPKKAGQLTLNLTLPGVASALGNLQIKEITEGGDIYVQLPAVVASHLPGGKPWIELDLAKSGSSSGLGSLAGGLSNNPGEVLQYLKAASTTGVQNLGSATVDGVETTHYRATINLTKVVAALPAAQRATAEKGVASLEKMTNLTSLPIDVWVDSDNLVRQMKLDYSIKPANSSETVTSAITLDFTGYGPQPVPATPPANQVGNDSSLLGSLIGDATGA